MRVCVNLCVCVFNGLYFYTYLNIYVHNLYIN